jgi:hypothetical protein
VVLVSVCSQGLGTAADFSTLVTAAGLKLLPSLVGWRFFLVLRVEVRVKGSNTTLFVLYPTTAQTAVVQSVAYWCMIYVSGA